MPTFEFPPRFQFSLRGLMIAVAVVAVVLGIVAFGKLGAMLLGLLLALLLRGIIPTCLVIGAIYGQGDLRAFAIGGVVANIPLLTTEIGPLDFGALIFATIAQLLAICICGTVAVVARRWIEPGGGR
jgi:hypothetical protein